MCKKFKLSVYEKTFTNCFLHFSKYANGNLQVSVFGTDPTNNLAGHFLDVSLDQDEIYLEENQIVVDTCYKPEITEQLEHLGILKQKIKMCVIGNAMYPIYSLDIPKSENYCYIEERLLCVA